MLLILFKIFALKLMKKIHNMGLWFVTQGTCEWVKYESSSWAKKPKSYLSYIFMNESLEKWEKKHIYVIPYIMYPNAWVAIKPLRW